LPKATANLLMAFRWSSFFLFFLHLNHKQQFCEVMLTRVFAGHSDLCKCWSSKGRACQQKKRTQPPGPSSC
jgi:hypothetical protein